jgi:hypothetical protein
MKPMDEEKEIKTLGELKVLLQKLPRLGEELDAFAADLEDSRKDQPFMPAGGLWE